MLEIEELSALSQQVRVVLIYSIQRSRSRSGHLLRFSKWRHALPAGSFAPCVTISLAMHAAPIMIPCNCHNPNPLYCLKLTVLDCVQYSASHCKNTSAAQFLPPFTCHLHHGAPNSGSRAFVKPIFPTQL